MLVLIGFMGAGKSTTGRRVATLRDVPHHDSDNQFSNRHGLPPGDYITSHGEPAFRALEASLVSDTLYRSDLRHAVYSLGGGAVLSDQVHQALTGHCVIHLYVSLVDATRRCGSSNRPLLADADPTWHSDRISLYDQLADHTIDTTDRTPPSVAAEVHALWPID